MLATYLAAVTKAFVRLLPNFNRMMLNDSDEYYSDESPRLVSAQNPSSSIYFRQSDNLPDTTYQLERKWGQRHCNCQFQHPAGRPFTEALMISGIIVAFLALVIWGILYYLDTCDCTNK